MEVVMYRVNQWAVQRTVCSVSGSAYRVFRTEIVYYGGGYVPC
jgi:hypothetical protein